MRLPSLLVGVRDISVAALVAAAVALGGCATPPPGGPPPPPEYSRPPRADGPLASLESAIHDASGPDTSSFRLIERNEDGLKWRFALVDSARHTLDLQYYVWYGDSIGLLLMKRIVTAADRGVKVRLILDDLDTLMRDADTPKVRDAPIVKIAGHPNIEIRLFNPWYNRSLVGRGIESASDLARLNHRMHNKLFIADNRVAIIGGRNIGAEYLGLNPRYNFFDLDLLGVGPVARQGSVVFDRYWNSPLAVEVSRLGLKPTPGHLPQMMAKVSARLAGAPELARLPLEPRDWAAELAALRPALQPGQSQVVADRPVEDTVKHSMPRAIQHLIGAATRELLIANAYIIPDQEMIETLRGLTAHGVTVRILTNSLATTDVPAVNSHYKQWRRPLIEAGVELHEVRPDAALKVTDADTPPISSAYMGLHAKAIVVDRERVFVGSMNLDPRSAGTNSEMGVVVESAGLGRLAAAVLGEAMSPENSWRVELDPDDGLRWVSGPQRLRFQPARSFWERVEDFVYVIFPPQLY